MEETYGRLRLGREATPINPSSRDSRQVGIAGEVPAQGFIIQLGQVTAMAYWLPSRLSIRPDAKGAKRDYRAHLSIIQLGQAQVKIGFESLYPGMTLMAKGAIPRLSIPHEQQGGRL